MLPIDFDFGALSEHLPAGWSYRPDPNRPNACFEGPDGARFFVRPARPRAQVIGVFPTTPERTYESFRAEIGVSLERSPRAVAGEIVRRFLPDYVSQLTRARQVVEEAEERAARRDLLARRLAELLPRECLVQLTASPSGDSVQVRGLLPAAEALAVAELLGRRAAGEVGEG